MDLQSIGRVLLVLAAAIALTGILMMIGGRLGLGSLPGDVKLQGQGWSCFVPIASSIVISLVLTLLLNVALRFFNR